MNTDEYIVNNTIHGVHEPKSFNDVTVNVLLWDCITVNNISAFFN